MTKDRKSDQQLIVQALNAAETNIRLAKKLLSGVAAAPPKTSTKDIPGITGTFDGENMCAPDGKKYPVNPNYASKSVLVYGDTLKRIEEDGQERFKQIARVKRHKVEGILAKKAGKWVAVTPDGSYQVSPVAVEFYGGKEGKEIVVVLPVDDKNAPYAALESVKREEEKEKESVGAQRAAPAKTIKKKPPAKKQATKKKAVVASPEPVEEKTPVPAPEPVAEPVENDEELR